MGYREDRWLSSRLHLEQVHHALETLVDRNSVKLKSLIPNCPKDQPNALHRRLFYPLFLNTHCGEILHLMDPAYGDCLIHGASHFSKTIVSVTDTAFWQHRTFWNTPIRARIVDGLKKADHLIAISEKTAQELRALLPESDVTMIHYASQPEIFQYSNQKRDPHLLLHVGTCSERKGTDLLLEVLAQLPRDFKLLQLGGVFSAEHRALIEKYKLEDRIQQKSYVTREELVSSYQRCRALIFPSRYEGFGAPVIEARLCGTRVITNPNVPARELLVEDELTQILDFSKIKECANAIQNADTRPKPVQNRSYFGWDRAGQEILALYERSLGYTLARAKRTQSPGIVSKKSPPDTLLYTTNGSLGGAERVALDVAHSLRRHGQNVAFIIPSQGTLSDQLEERDFDYYLLPFGRSLEKASQSSRWNFLSSFVRIADLFKLMASYRNLMSHTRAQAVMTHGVKAEFVSVIAQPFKAIARIWYLHVFPARGPLTFVERFLSKKVRVMIANSHAVRDAWPKPHQNNISVVHCVISHESISDVLPGSRNDFLKKLGLPTLSSQDRMIGMVSILAPWKGVDLFIESLAPLLKTHSNLYGLICGGVIYQTEGHADYDAFLREKVKSLGLEKRIFFIPFQVNVAPVYQCLDIVVHASKEPEPFGRIISEARLFGKPIIATRGGGAEEQVVHEQTGLLIPPQSQEALTRAIDRLLKDQKLCKFIATQGRSWVLEHLSLERFEASIFTALSAAITSSQVKTDENVDSTSSTRVA